MKHYDYPEVAISEEHREIVQSQGMLHPVVMNADGEVCKRHRERYMAFKTESAKLEDGIKFCYAYRWKDLSEEDKAHYK